MVPGLVEGGETAAGGGVQEVRVDVVLEDLVSSCQYMFVKSG